MRPEKLWLLSCRAYARGFTLLARILKGINFFVFHAILPYEAEVESDIVLEHYGMGVVIHPNCRIGKRVRLYHGVTLAAETAVGSEHGIVVGDDVMIGAGASVIARTDTSLHIGSGAQIGAGAVVTRDVEPNQVMVGVPARPIRSRCGDHNSEGKCAVQEAGH